MVAMKARGRRGNGRMTDQNVAVPYPFKGVAEGLLVEEILNLS